MATHCINKSSKEFKELKDSTNEHPAVVAADISIWQSQYETNRYPTIDELSSQSGVLHYDSSLRKGMIEFVKGLNIKVEENDDDLLDKLNLKVGNPLSAFDVLQKYLSLKSTITNKDLSLQTANIIYTFLGKKSVLGIELWNSIKEWSKYKEIYDKYSKINEETSEDADYTEVHFNTFAHKQAIVHLIAEALENNWGEHKEANKYNNEDLNVEYFEKLGYRNKYEHNLLIKLFNDIWNWINEHILRNKAINELNKEKLIDLALNIVDDVYNKNYDKFIRGIEEKDGKLFKVKGDKKIELELKDYSTTLKKDPYAKSVIDKLTQHPFIQFKISGSLSIRKYGKLYRDINEDLHDIDGVITLDNFKKEENSESFSEWLRTRGRYLAFSGKRDRFMRETSPKLEEQSWYKNVKSTLPTWELTNIFLGKDHKNAESVTVQGTIEHPTLKDENGVAIKYAIDFFVRTNNTIKEEKFDNYWKEWKQIFEAKLNMGRSKDINDLIYYDPFIADKYKFNSKGYRYFTFNENDLYNHTQSSNSFETKYDFYTDNEDKINKKFGGMTREQYDNLSEEEQEQIKKCL